VRHSPDPNNDPTNANIVNWIKRRRTQRFLTDPANPGQPHPTKPFPAALAAADATTGNLVVGNFQ
jgi:hypothetical protein